MQRGDSLWTREALAQDELAPCPALLRVCQLVSHSLIMRWRDNLEKCLVDQSLSRRHLDRLLQVHLLEAQLMAVRLLQLQLLETRLL